ncbi:putative sulfate exporter family transporter [Clostridiaceae bacterium M8S5]|nr:putative sulfate exporter family transporter [Clostridiaceae bacterium M8S5]
MKSINRYIPGILLVFTIAYISKIFSKYLNSYISIEALTIAIIIGIVYNNCIKVKSGYKAGIKFSLSVLLKIGIVLLGFRLNIQDLFKLGPKIIILVIVYALLVLSISVLLGKIFKVQNKLATLIGVGSCICGASAIVALKPCIHADDEDSVIAVSIVSFLGTIGVLVYSAIAKSNIDISDLQYGAWSGLTLHGVSHAIAASFALGKTAGDIGTFVKMTRVLMIMPVSIVLSYIYNKQETVGVQRVKIPMYVVYFIFIVILNSTGIIPLLMTDIFLRLSSICILMAMTAMGLSVDFNSIINKGVKALGIGTITFFALSLASFFAIVKLL